MTFAPSQAPNGHDSGAFVVRLQRLVLVSGMISAVDTGCWGRRAFSHRYKQRRADRSSCLRLRAAIKKSQRIFWRHSLDDVISRGRWGDWAELRQAALADQSLLDKVARVCLAYVSDPYAQRHHFWMHYAKEHRTAA